MDLQHLRASDGTGEAVLAHIQSVRNPGSTVLDLDNVDNWNAKAIVLTGTPAANGFISPVGMKVMYGHLNAGDFIIDGYAPGYADNGNTTAEVAIVKMTTNWADTLVDLLKQTLADNGKIKTDGIDSETMFADSVDPVKRMSELMFDNVASGGVWTGDNYNVNRNASLTAGVIYINGRRLTFSAVNARTFTASKDTYVDLLDAGNGTATVVYTEVANNAASPALAANSVRLAIIVTGASAIVNVGSINQGQIGKLLPIASSVPYATTDSIGNLICPRDPFRKVLAMRRITATFATTSVSPVQIVGLTAPVIIPLGRKAKVSLSGDSFENSVSAAYAQATLWTGTVGSGTQLMRSITRAATNAMTTPINTQAFIEGTGAPITINAGLNILASGQASVNADPTYPLTLAIELE